MKKNIILAALFCFSIVSCSKVGLTPDAPATTTDNTQTGNQTGSGDNSNLGKKGNPLELAPIKGGDDGVAIDPTAKCFTITNTEKAEGLLEYKFSYVDEHGKIQTASLGFGQSISFSSISGTVKANFQYFLIEGGGNCGPRRTAIAPGPCDYYTIKNPNSKLGVRVWYEFTDCDGHYNRGELAPLGLIIITAVPGSVNCPNGVVLPMR